MGLKTPRLNDYKWFKTQTPMAASHLNTGGWTDLAAKVRNGAEIPNFGRAFIAACHHFLALI